MISNFFNIPDVPHSTHNITIPDGSILSIIKKRDILFHAGFILRNVLYVPQIQINLLFVSEHCLDYNCTLFFDSTICCLQDRIKRKLLPLGEFSNCLYYLLDNASNLPSCAVNVTTMNKEHGASTNTILK